MRLDSGDAPSMAYKRGRNSMLCLTLCVLILCSQVAWGANRYALVIASGDFPKGSVNARYRINAPHNDARLMISLLLWRFHFKPADIYVVGLSQHELNDMELGHSGLLHNGGDTATFSNIRAGFKWLAASVQETRDSALIYYSGHGKDRVYNPDPDAPDVNSEALVPYDVEPPDGNLIRDTQIRSWLLKIRSMHKTVIVDACFSGEIIRDLKLEDETVLSRALPSDRSAPLQESGVLAPMQNSLPPGTVLLAACGKTEKARSCKVGDKPVGRFTRALYYVLCHDQSPLTIEQLYKKVIAHTEFLGYLQHPVLLGRNEDSVAIAAVKWPSPGTKLPVVAEDGGDCMLDVGFIAGIEEDARVNVLPGDKRLSFGSVDAFRSHIRGAVPSNNYITVSLFPQESGTP